jgi:hypothetical protein
MQQTITAHHKLYPWTSIMASPFSCDPTGTLDCSAALELLKATYSNVMTVHIPKGTFRIAKNLTIPEGIKLVFEMGASFIIATKMTLTINGPIDLSNQTTCFSVEGTGAVAYGTTCRKISYVTV